MQSLSTRRLAGVTAGLALAFSLWDATGLDLAMARWFGGPEGFPLRENWWLNNIFHDGARNVAWLVIALLAVSVWLPLGAIKKLPLNRRVQLVTTTIVAAAVIGLMKTFSFTSCPWNLSDFGGMAQYSSHWAHFLHPDGGGGGCFPAGHATAGFCFLAGYFAFRRDQPETARRWLAGAIAAGLIAGFAQQMRGAHFMSHTLWTGWVCWCVAWAMDAFFSWFDLRSMAADLGEPA